MSEKVIVLHPELAVHKGDERHASRVPEASLEEAAVPSTASRR